MAEYAHPEVLVSTQWVAEHSNDPKVRLVEVDVDTSAYDQGHIAGAVGWNWQTQLQDNIRRDLIEKGGARTTARAIGNFERYDRRSLRRQQQLVRGLCLLAAEILRTQGRPADERRTQEVARRKAAADHRRAQGHAGHLSCDRCRMNPCARGRKRLRRLWTKRRKGHLVDVRSVDEFTGKIIAPPGMSETAQRAGHIPGAANVPWAQAANEDGTFKSADALEAALPRKRGNRR